MTLVVAAVLMLAGAARAASSSPEDALRGADRWFSERVQECAKTAAKFGFSYGSVLEVETEIAGNVREAGAFYTKLQGKPKIALAYVWPKDEMILVLHGEVGVRQGAGVEDLAEIEMGPAGRLTLTFTAPRSTPGAMTRLFIFLMFGLDAGKEQQMEALLKMIPDQQFAEFASFVGGALGDAARAVSGGIAQVRSGIDQNPVAGAVAQVTGVGQALAGAQAGLKAIASNPGVLAQLAMAVKTAPPLAKLLTRFKADAGLQAKIEAGTNSGEGEMMVGREVRLDRGQTLNCLRFGVQGKTANGEGGLNVEVKQGNEKPAFEVVISGGAASLKYLVPQLASQAGNFGAGQVTFELQPAFTATNGRALEPAAMLAKVAQAVREQLQSRKAFQSLGSALKFAGRIANVKAEATAGRTANIALDLKVLEVNIKPSISGIFATGDGTGPTSNLTDLFVNL